MSISRRYLVSEIKQVGNKSICGRGYNDTQLGFLVTADGSPAVVLSGRPEKEEQKTASSPSSTRSDRRPLIGMLPGIRTSGFPASAVSVSARLPERRSDRESSLDVTGKSVTRLQYLNLVQQPSRPLAYEELLLVKKT
ncbi:hypothetical protein NDU88_001910 [Pleurodeles waltl]|uniref:Uncharacterized protein n=1 Tax=Pleurodeles waltl TaxID=8319 RepID=A0AAV7VB37_PLEWA|nr:hypothetical protein NDU88_001910 [Pleurodeles waltl]